MILGIENPHIRYVEQTLLRNSLSVRLTSCILYNLQSLKSCRPHSNNFYSRIAIPYENNEQRYNRNWNIRHGQQNLTKLSKIAIYWEKVATRLISSKWQILEIASRYSMLLQHIASFLVRHCESWPQRRIGISRWRHSGILHQMRSEWVFKYTRIYTLYQLYPHIHYGSECKLYGPGRQRGNPHAENQGGRNLPPPRIVRFQNGFNAL